MWSRWIYAFQIGDPQRALYSVRFPVPVFYLVEMTWPYFDLHPISIFMYALGLVGIGMFAWRRKAEDKLLLVWFLVIYLIFTSIGNRQWRYVMPLFPVLAISASTLVSFSYDRGKRVWQKSTNKLSTKQIAKVAAGVLIAFTASAVFVSCGDAYQLVSLYQVHIPIEDAAKYVVDKIQTNESIIVIGGSELFNNNVVGFHLQVNQKQNRVLQYPELPVDTFMPDFKIGELINTCQKNNVKYALLYEFGFGHYFNSSLTSRDFTNLIYSSGNFVQETEIGTSPNRIFIICFEK